MKRKLIFFAVLATLLAPAAVRVHAMLVTDGEKDATVGIKGKFSESDTFLDLNTGKTFQLLYDGLNEIYNRSDLFALDLYVNNRTKDTMWLEDAIVVNNALLKDANGTYKVDPMKVKRDGNSYRVVLPKVKAPAVSTAQ
jgi:hypothetical protein